MMGAIGRITRGSGRRYAVVAAVGLGLLASGCGDDSTTSSSASRATTVEVKAVDYGFEGLPRSVKAGTSLKLTNDSKREVHELVAVRLPDDERRSVADLVKLPEEQLMGLFTGPPALVLLAPPGGGEQVVAEGDGTLREPGRYLVLCNVPTGADANAFLNSTGPGQVTGGAPHHVHGMYAEVTVQ
jgi:plastocyanin